MSTNPYKIRSSYSSEFYIISVYTENDSDQVRYINNDYCDNGDIDYTICINKAMRFCELSMVREFLKRNPDIKLCGIHKIENSMRIIGEMGRIEGDI